ncbi:adenylate cyclase [Acrasis kona]|uniref:Adenylate cyclase n=1 Tax=Acrasis kona TaxID=1008807 RepID=A0AAW2YNN8_9EUKA
MTALTLYLYDPNTNQSTELQVAYDITKTICSLIIAIVCVFTANVFAGLNYLRNPKNVENTVAASNDEALVNDVNNVEDIRQIGKTIRYKRYLKYSKSLKNEVEENVALTDEAYQTAVTETNYTAGRRRSSVMETLSKIKNRFSAAQDNAAIAFLKNTPEKKKEKNKTAIKNMLQEILKDKRKPQWWQILLGGILIAAGACGMHYLGMEAMIVQGHHVYNPGLVALSVIIAITAGTVGLTICFYVNSSWLLIVASFCISTAVSAMHYTGMGAITFMYSKDINTVTTAIQTNVLVLSITFATVTICFAMIVVVSLSLYQRQTRLFDKLNNEYSKVQDERQKSELLLLNILPKHISERIKKGDVVCDDMDNVTILFCDICGFTSMSNDMPPAVIVSMLNELFTEFDDSLESYGVEKIKTIGDAYMIVSGIVPTPNHAECCLEFGIQMINTVRSYNELHGTNIGIRVGLNTGRVIAGIIGSKKFTYDVWGDAVNLASRMESTAPPMNIQVSESSYEILKKSYNFHRKELIVKGKGTLFAYVLDSKYLQFQSSDDIKLVDQVDPSQPMSKFQQTNEVTPFN